MPGKTGTRNTGMDILKFICAFAVVCIHLEYPGKTYLEPFTRVAVPVFFMISGYHYEGVCQKGQENRQLIKLLKMLATACILYFLVECLLYFVAGREPAFDFASLKKAGYWV